MQKIKTILVTGGAGFIGSHLCERLIKENFSVISLDDYSAGKKENHIESVDYRVGHTKDIEKHVPEHVDMVYHLGEYSRVEQSFDDINKVLENNLVGTQAVVRFCLERKIKLIYAGSSTKFADECDGKDQSPYAWTKAINTELVRNFGEWFGLDYAITYFYNVYGPRERGDLKTGTVIGIFAENFKNNKPLQVRLPGSQKRNFTHVFDIVEGLFLVGEKGHGDEYGIGHPDSFSILDVAKMFGSEINMIPDRKGNRSSSSLDLRKIKKLGWSPKYDLSFYIKRLIKK